MIRAFLMGGYSIALHLLRWKIFCVSPDLHVVLSAAYLLVASLGVFCTVGFEESFSFNIQEASNVLEDLDCVASLMPFITGIRIFFILNNKTCIWICWTPALTASHRTFHTMLLAAASSRSVAQLHLMFFSSSPGAGGRSVDLGKYPVSNRFHPQTFAWRLQSMLFHCWTWRNTL